MNCMDKYKSTWKNLTKLEKNMVCLRNIACICILIVALFQGVGIPPCGAAAWLLPVTAISQTVLSWNRSRGTAVLFLVSLAVFVFLFFLSKG